ncbi:hypothetical protein CHCC20335_3144 [Bacillus paralicheniformis]|nr:hypothetical protein CHCC20335_3144 [Bacillus paralicheniformis]
MKPEFFFLKRAIPVPEWLFYFHFLFSNVIINKRTVGQAM